MIIGIVSFSEKGYTLQEQVIENFPEYIWFEKEGNLKEWVATCFQYRYPILFIGATGIATRLIAPFVKNKTKDSAILVMDELANFVIPLLAGHIGGANDLTRKLAKRMDATPVITTATDMENVFAVDVFAQKNSFRIVDTKGIQKISSKLLNKEKCTISIDPSIHFRKEEIPSCLTLVETGGDICLVRNEKDIPCLIQLVFQPWAVGMGCKRGKSFEELQAFLLENVNGKDVWKIGSLNSIDLKKREWGLHTLAQYNGWKLHLYAKEELETVKEVSASSDFVKEITGVDNVCERAALMHGGELLVPKLSKNGMTFALASIVACVKTWETGYGE